MAKHPEDTNLRRILRGPELRCSVRTPIDCPVCSSWPGTDVEARSLNYVITLENRSANSRRAGVGPRPKLVRVVQNTLVDIPRMMITDVPARAPYRRRISSSDPSAGLRSGSASDIPNRGADSHG
jgi:hypothetical protein